MDGLVALALAKKSGKNYTDSVALNGVAVNYPQVDSTTQHWKIFDPVANAYTDTGIVARGVSPKLSAANTWEIWNDTTGAYVDTGLAAQGDKGDQGDQGDEGPMGPAGKISEFMIPFAGSGSAPQIGVSNTGASDNIATLCWANTCVTQNLIGDAIDTRFAGSQFTLDLSSNDRKYQFIAPDNITLDTIAFTIEPWASANMGTVNYWPYVMLATAPLGSDTFTLQPSTLAVTNNPLTGQITPTSIRYSVTKDIAYQITEGTQIMIVAGMYATNGTGSYIGDQYIYFNGSVLFSSIPTGESGGGGGGEGTLDHSQLTNRTLPDQHPQNAITGLVTQLSLLAASTGVSAFTYDSATRKLGVADNKGTNLSLILPQCSSTVDGLMTTADVVSMVDLVSKVASLVEGGLWRATYDTYSDLTTAYPNLDVSSTNWTQNDYVYVLADENYDSTNKPETSYITVISGNTKTLEFRKIENSVQGTIPVATNTSQGIVQGTPTTEGKIYVETDGSMSLLGYDDLNSGVTGAVPKSGATMTGALVGVSGTDYTTAQFRNAVLSTTDLTAGTSALANGSLYFVYE